MRRQNMAVVLPLEHGFSSLVRATSSVMVSAVVGLTLALLIPLPAPIPILAGLAVGVVVGSPVHPRGVEEWLGRTILSVGGAFLAGLLFYRGLTLAAWLVTIGTLAFGAGISDTGWWRPIARWLFGGVVLGGILYLVSTLIPLAPARWGIGTLLELLAVSVALAVSTWTTARLEVRSVWGAGQHLSAPASVPAKAPKPVEEVLYGKERRALDEVARRVKGLVSQLVQTAPAEIGFAEQIDRTLKETLRQADESIARWRAIRKSESQERTKDLELRIRDNEEKLAKTGDESVRRALDLTLQRQRLTWEQYRKMDAAQKAFGLRLQQVRSGLELLELSLERALTFSGTVSSDELDSIVEAMNEVHAALDFESEMETAFQELSSEMAVEDSRSVA
ncbi:MAG: hypothetical protein JW797_08495 [Bradymonadales bacterium]|nr:hypothetical protein [Bradymonadales bacterium]